MELNDILRMADKTLSRGDAVAVRELSMEALGYGRGMLDSDAEGQEGLPAVSDSALRFATAYAQVAYDSANGHGSRPAIWSAWQAWITTGTVSGAPLGWTSVTA